MDFKEIIIKLEAMENPRNVEGMARFGITAKSKILGIPMPETRKLAKQIGKNHGLAIKLFEAGIHEAQILASLVAQAEKLSEKEIEHWVKLFDSWDVVDQVCMNLFDKSKIAVKKIADFGKREAEFEKRAAFSLIVALASHDKRMQDKDFIKFFPLIKKASIDERNFVKKAVNWALRGIGKRNNNLNKEAIKLAEEIRNLQSGSARWIANDAIRELKSEGVRKRLSKTV